MATRIDLHNSLLTLLGSNYVYFQPPSNIMLNYPCIVYSRQAKDEKFADNARYLDRTRYGVTVIDQDPDSDIPGKVATLPLSTFDRHYVSDGLNHDVYSVYI